MSYYAWAYVYMVLSGGIIRYNDSNSSETPVVVRAHNIKINTINMLPFGAWSPRERIYFIIMIVVPMQFITTVSVLTLRPSICNSNRKRICKSVTDHGGHIDWSNHLQQRGWQVKSRDAESALVWHHTSKGAKTTSALGYEKQIIFNMIIFCWYFVPKT